MRGVILVSLENASFHMLYTINTLCNWPSIVTKGGGGRIMVCLFCHIPMLFLSVI